MISFSLIDILVVLLFFASIIFIGFYTGRKTSSQADDYLLSGRKLKLFTFVLINVSTWYGGILGVGEFTYRYGLVSWFTQGFPYYIFAFLFGIFFAKKIREASLFTIPDKLNEVYGEKVGLISAVIVFVLVSPAPYFLMSASLISLLFKIEILPSLIITFILSIIYLVKGGFRSNVYVDVFQFFVMFIGFILILVFSGIEFGTVNFITSSVPANHIKVFGGMSLTFIIVWFLIALWTFADPGFHQRCYAAKSGNVAMKGILISIFFWALFDFLTTSTGLFSKAVLQNLENPVLAFPLFAEKVLPAGVKGIFYAALFATIISTQISFLFLSGTTIGRDFIFRIKNDVNELNLKHYTIIGLIISGSLAILLAYFIPSVIEIWYTIGSLFIPGIILPVISAYYPKIRIEKKFILVEMISALAMSTTWLFIRESFSSVKIINEIEPMLVGLILAFIIHFVRLLLLWK
ncbi:sodium:solute symporter family protein [bacterium BMS3Abin03]|jgi:SSS family solute:Na+ symporter|nr:sodium:solute symporter family protein [bacterium BMS3Abin03]MCG6961377.1 sodium:solute symporter family protein [bacterium BMS3Abin03]